MAEPEGISLIVPYSASQSSIASEVVTRWHKALSVFKRPVDAVLVGPGAEASEGIVAIELVGGLGEQIRAGIAATRQPLILVVGCDHPFSPADLPKLLNAIALRDEELNVGVDFVTGARASTPVSGWGKAVHGIYRRGMKLALNLSVEPLYGKLAFKDRFRRFVARTLFAVRVQDPQSSLKLIRRPLLDRFVTQSAGPMILTELLAKANFLSAVMSEVPVGSPQKSQFVAYSENPSWGRECWKLLREPKFRAEPAVRARSVGEDLIPE